MLIWEYSDVPPLIRADNDPTAIGIRIAMINSLLFFIFIIFHFSFSLIIDLLYEGLEKIMSLQRLTSNESLYGRNLIAYPVQLIVKNSKIILLKLINCLRRHSSYVIV